MKTKLLKFIAFGASLLLIASCSSPNSVADKALKVVGLGTFAPSDVDRYLGNSYGSEILSLFTDYDDIFDNALIERDEAQNFRKYGFYRRAERSNFFYFSNAIFEKWELVKEDDISYDLYTLVDYSQFEGVDENTIKSLRDYARNNHEDYQESGLVSTWMVAKNVPAKLLRYKLDNRFFANLTVINVPEKGYRVCAFRIE